MIYYERNYRYFDNRTYEMIYNTRYIIELDREHRIKRDENIDFIKVLEILSLLKNNRNAFKYEYLKYPSDMLILEHFELDDMRFREHFNYRNYRKYGWGLFEDSKYEYNKIVIMFEGYINDILCSESAKVNNS